MGGHQVGPVKEATPKPKTVEGPQESTTARLLKAKKRARDQDGKDQK
jgi:hypothetical protein